MTVVAIHQPTFLPWLGWWDKLVRADIFVLLDDVQFPKTGGNWTNRARFIVNGRPAWVTVPVDRAFHGVRSIREMRIADDKPWREQVMKTLQSSYGRARYFDELEPVVEQVVRAPTDSLAELTECGIRAICRGLRLPPTKFISQSDLGIVGRGTRLLVDICVATGATVYLNGDGAAGYFEPDAFARRGIRVRQQSFVSPVYPQLGVPYTPGLSIVDSLMNCGWETVRGLVVRDGQGPSGRPA